MLINSSEPVSHPQSLPLIYHSLWWNYSIKNQHNRYFLSLFPKAVTLTSATWTQRRQVCCSARRNWLCGRWPWCRSNYASGSWGPRTWRVRSRRTKQEQETSQWMSFTCNTKWRGTLARWSRVLTRRRSPLPSLMFGVLSVGDDISAVIAALLGWWGITEYYVWSWRIQVEREREIWGREWVMDKQAEMRSSLVNGALCEWRYCPVDDLMMSLQIEPKGWAMAYLTPPSP